MVLAKAAESGRPAIAILRRSLLEEIMSLSRKRTVYAGALYCLVRYGRSRDGRTVIGNSRGFRGFCIDGEYVHPAFGYVNCSLIGAGRSNLVVAGAKSQDQGRLAFRLAVDADGHLLRIGIDVNGLKAIVQQDKAILLCGYVDDPLCSSIIRRRHREGVASVSQRQIARGGTLERVVAIHDNLGRRRAACKMNGDLGFFGS